MKHVIMTEENERMIGVEKEEGKYFLTIMVREFFAPSMEMEFKVKPVRIEIDELTDSELEKYNDLLLRVEETV